MMHYSIIEVYTSEDIHWHGKPLYTAIMNYVSGQKIAARCIATRGNEGCYENGELSTSRIEILSYKMPVKLEIILPASEVDRVLPTIEKMVIDGIVCVRELNVVSHKVQKHLLPRNLRVRDIMTGNPVKVTPATPVSDVVKLLLAAEFNGVPVVDEKDHPIGMITQGDLIERGGMPLRLGLISRWADTDMNALLKTMAGRTASEIMTTRVVSVSDEQRVTDAVDAMLSHDLKRMPVVDESGRITGMLSRFDVFQTITNDLDVWEKLPTHDIPVNSSAPVKNIMRRDAHTVREDAPLDEVIRTIDSNNIQRLAVVDSAGRLLGMLSDHDLLSFFTSYGASFWDVVASKLTFTEMGRRHRQAIEKASKRTAGELMKTNLVSIEENASIDDAIRIMTDKGFKRLPVVDDDGVFKGMISRDTLLRTGMKDAPHRQ